jgi:hypothetical protein
MQDKNSFSSRVSILYSKLFNFIFDKGVVPVSWCVGVITPIFRSKGNSKDPKNDKAFTLMRYFQFQLEI